MPALKNWSTTALFRPFSDWTAAGVLTNRQFEDKGEFESADDAIRAVFWGGP